MNPTLVFLGAGKIAEAWIERLIASGATPAAGIVACDPSHARLGDLRSRFAGLITTADNPDGAGRGKIVVLATPPPDVVPVLSSVAPALQPGATVISLAAGVPLARLVKAVPGVSVVRVMPNTPSMVGAGMNLFCPAPGVSFETRQTVESLLARFGRFLEIREEQMEAYAALCAVGPTFLFPLMQSLMACAVEAGVPENLARMATAQVFVGTGQLVAATTASVTELNGMIGLHTLAEPQAVQLIAEAYKTALAKLSALAARMAAGA
jgi:pyrroline-5-carboxylate reductase